jgi:hypothetical protein
MNKEPIKGSSTPMLSDNLQRIAAIIRKTQASDRWQEAHLVRISKFEERELSTQNH